MLQPRRFGSGFTEELALSPLPRHRNFEDLSGRLEDFSDFNNYQPGSFSSQYLSRDSVISQELEEVEALGYEARNRKSSSCSNEISPEYQNIFYNEHYISDIDENEEIKEFICGYNSPERRFSDQCDSRVPINFRTNTLPSVSTSRHAKSFPSYQCGQMCGTTFESSSSMKSSDYYGYSPPDSIRTRSPAFIEKTVIKCPQRPVVKLAKIR